MEPFWKKRLHFAFFPMSQGKRVVIAKLSDLRQLGLAITLRRRRRRRRRRKEGRKEGRRKERKKERKKETIKSGIQAATKSRSRAHLEAAETSKVKTEASLV